MFSFYSGRIMAIKFTFFYSTCSMKFFCIPVVFDFLDHFLINSMLFVFQIIV